MGLLLAQADQEPPDPVTKAFVRTYNDPSYPDPWQALVDYRRVQAYRHSRPNEGRTTVGVALDLPPGRVRGWLNDAKPDVMRGNEIARESRLASFRSRL